MTESLTLDQARLLLHPILGLTVVNPPEIMPNDHPAGFQFEAQFRLPDGKLLSSALGYSEWDAVQRLISGSLLEWTDQMLKAETK